MAKPVYPDGWCGTLLGLQGYSMHNNDEFLFELTAPSGTTLLNVGNVPCLTAMAVHPVLPDEDPNAPFPSTEMTPEQRQTFRRKMTIAEHRKLLNAAIESGVMPVLNHLTYLPVTDVTHPYVDYQLVSVHDFIRFANTLKIRVLINDPDDVVGTTPAPPAAQNPQDAPVGNVGTSAAPPKQRAQENRIVELLVAQHYDPLALPARPTGGSGAKAEIKKLALLEPALFSESSYEKAWSRLRGDSRVIGGE